ncbi:N-acetyltransferase [Muribaculum sp. NM65_B17]|jgi:GNAT superfamily N-acetyltransferase|uniref:N-acetyltransferase n=1 Tax=unclassified Muribaculum TaxID=2622126 RepID=UPI001093DC9A|nr:N-acetyltransferase [Muribaculum sp. NM65_B17]TGY03967.1 N-acetyltransferase [Muribaculum sp. NM65_B17]THG43372.1 N-acetyltransferase [Muribaculaceae bacterium]
MAVEIREITPTKSNLKKYTKFGIDLYKGNDYYVPPLIMDDVETLSPDKNPAFDYCKAKSWMAYRDGKPVGRITGIINTVVNERTGKRDLRFGFLDFIDDKEVVDALFDALAEWGRSQGLTSMVGPMGFSDMDHEGMLTEGFEELGTMATIYNYPYYPQHMERMGFHKDAEWVEYRMTVPDKIPEKMLRVAEIVKKKYGVRTIKYTSAKKIKEEYGMALFELINEAYDQLYGYSPLSQRQIEYYIDIYLPILRLENVCLIVDSNDKLIGVGISIPSMSRALQKGRGRLLPTGWIHLLKAMYMHNDVVDLLLVAIKPEYQSKGVNALLFADLLPVYIKNGYRWAESNPELADNENVQLQWQYFERRQHRRRAAFRKDIPAAK